MNTFNKISIIGMIISLFILINSENYGPDYDLSQDELLEKYGYYYESYEVVTEDKYILTLIRLPCGKNKKWKNDTNPILIGHGLASSSMHWLINGPEKSIAFRLVDEGYDVWLANWRGNKYSRKHEYLNPDQKFSSYWDFGFHESGYFDLPAMINFILSKTNKEQIIYIAVSQGTTNFFVMGSTRPEYNDKIQFAITMAPVAFLTNPPGLLLNLLKDNEHLLNFLDENLLDIKEVSFSKPLLNLFKLGCKDGSPFQNICFNALVYGFHCDPNQINRTMLPTILVNLSSVSLKTIKHFLQLIKTDSFKQYDYGHHLNINIYRQPHPPKYNLKLVTAPIKIIYAKNDVFINVQDIRKLINILPNVIEVKKVEDELFGHVDFNFAIDINPLVYDDIVNTVKKYIINVKEI